MKGYLYIISTISFLLGIALVLYTDTLRNRLRLLISIGKTAERIISFFVLAAGVTIAFAAVDGLNFEFILGSGIIIALAGLVFLINPKRIFEKTVEWLVDKASPQVLRLFGILLVIMGEAVWFSV